MKIDIIIVYIQRYKKGHELNFVPPLTGIHLAALTPKEHNVRIIHQQVESVDFNTDADVIGLSFFSGFAPEAYRLASIFKEKGKIVIAGGPHASFLVDETLRYCHSVIKGEAEGIWEKILQDIKDGKLEKIYEGSSFQLNNLPVPRYDLLPKSYIVKKVVQATRGCPFTCSFCSVSAIHPGFRMRPVEDVIRDITYDDFTNWWERKIAWFWDDNLTANRKYIKKLLKAMIPLKKWWLTQASIDIAIDEELLDLMKKSGCIGVFLGIETLSQNALISANKNQNKVEYYRTCIENLHKYGICVMAGFMSGFNEDTPEEVEKMAENLYKIGVDVPFLSILTPFKGTKLYNEMEKENRIIKERGWEFYNGYNVVFKPANMTAEELIKSHRKLWNKAFSSVHTMKRIIRSFTYLRPGALIMSTAMNLFYCLKKNRLNPPAVMKD